MGTCRAAVDPGGKYQRVKPSTRLIRATGLFEARQAFDALTSEGLDPHLFAIVDRQSIELDPASGEPLDRSR